ncbi:GNAT family N-acetyltransferase [Yasminevirus sp. GU-2018]|uniref:GNAT family N-acetyltransferase n=1 Tax=Yasminevirus sp. GU-2018 TaxID=2420051 RepID=A0A5K0UC82_9VIRU|nr:GNAT family N-acetyltransferase [Yasminevirus sp. GU-2018]
MCYDLIKHEVDEKGDVQYDIRPENFNDQTDEDVCIGYCVFRYKPSPTWCDNVVDITEVYINPEYRGQGLTAELMKTVLQDAYSKNFTHVTLSSPTDKYLTDENLTEILRMSTKGNIRHILFG